MWHLILLHAIFASTYSIGKAALYYVEPIFFVAMRMICSGLILIAYRLFVQKKSLTFKKEHFWLFFQLAFLLIYLSYVLDFAVVKYVDSSKWALLFTLTPFCVGIFSYFLLNESLTRKKALGLFIGFVGVIPVVLNKTGQEGILGSFLIFSVSELCMFASMLLYSYSWIVARKLIKNEGYSAIHVNGITMLAGGILSLITSPFMDNWSPSPIMNMNGFLSMLGLIIIANIFVYVGNMYLIRIYTVTFIKFLIFIDTLYVALYGWLFLGETVSWPFYTSVLLVFVGLYIFYQEELRERYVA